ncbi:MAG: 2-hydroxyacid dehydrogenase [Planctomycetota bacterium]
MKVVVFSTKPYDRSFLELASAGENHSWTFLETRLTMDTARLATNHDAVCAFVNDQLDAEVMRALSELKVRLVVLRCAGYNNVDLAAAGQFDVCVARVPAYSPHAVAEHAVALVLSVNRGIHRAYGRTREGNFSLDGLLGFDLYGSIVGVIGTGKIGTEFARIMTGFGCRVLASDAHENAECVDMGVQYVNLDDLFERSDIISLHCPLTPDTRHLIDADALAKMKMGVTIINTSRGAVVDASALIQGLKTGKVGRLGLDVYEEEADFFFEDLSNQVISDDTLARLLTFPNVLITGHQAFLTKEALTGIAETTVKNLNDFEGSGGCINRVSAT